MQVSLHELTHFAYHELLVVDVVDFVVDLVVDVVDFVVDEVVEVVEVVVVVILANDAISVVFAFIVKAYGFDVLPSLHDENLYPEAAVACISILVP